MSHSGTLEKTNALATADPLAAVWSPSSRKHKAETYRLTGQLVIIIALHCRREASATSANNEVTKTAKNDKGIESKGCRGRDLVSVLGAYTEYECLPAYGSLDTCSDLGLLVNFALDRMWLSAWDSAGLKTAQWHFPALQWVDRTALIAIDTYFQLGFTAFHYNLVQQQCERKDKDSAIWCVIVSKDCRATVIKGLQGRLCLKGRKRRKKDGKWEGR